MQDYESLKQYLLLKPMSKLDFPFGDDTSVFRVKDKMFALVGGRDDRLMMTLKCTPVEGVELRDIFDCIKEGYYMNKKHWISIYFSNTIPDDEIIRLIDNSYLLVVQNMTKKEQKSILSQLL